ncbi:hypothetical protein M0M57_07785 [Flavobacterium azooxidireducens]|uniref:Uncharacterized protein n=1 Tax=Flavobacterium azooxidireducens TaxID=1871076 RepID=A0ABY4KJK1_9FLAO|nr:hypothetical protein [Flavobacterium azooxidireducens]UPQ80729.1 hypothetical protein M0M57_07785 [Flavobacterium azooxidireducens]
MKSLLFLVQAANLEDKLKNAPDDSYQIGLIIGSFVPFIALVAIAYWMYYAAKKRENNP